MPTPASSSSRSGAVPRKLSASPGGRAVARAALASLPTPQLTTQLQAGLSDVTRRIAVDAPRHVGTVRALGDAVTEVVARWRRSTALSLSGIGALENDVARMLVLIRQQNSRLKAQKTQIEALQREKEAMRSYAANLERLVPDKDKPAPVPASGPGNAEARATNERKIAELSQAVKQGDREALNRFFDALETESMNEGSDQSSSPPGSTSAAKAAAAAAAPAKPTQPKTTPKASGKSKQTKPSAAPPPPPPAPPALPAPPTPSSRKTGSHASPPQPASTPPPPRVAASSASPSARAGSSSSGSGSGSAVAAPVHSSPALPPPASPAVPVADVPVVDAATPKPPTDEDTATLQRAMAFAAQGAPTPTAPPPARKPPARPTPSPAVAKAVAAASNGAAPPTAPAPAPAPTRPPPPPVAPARPPGPPPTSAAPASSGTSAGGGGGGGGGDVMGPDTVLIELRLDEEQHKRATVGDLKDAVRGQVGRPFTAVLANGRLLLKDSAMLAEAGIGTSVTLEVRFRSQHTSTSTKAAPPRASAPPGAFRG